MANSPTDTVSTMMEQDFGTKYLITDPRSDRYLDKELGQKKFTKFCGGAGGWDDFCERMGE